MGAVAVIPFAKVHADFVPCQALSPAVFHFSGHENARSLCGPVLGGQKPSHLVVDRLTGGRVSAVI
jgi:hypothetical protein